MAVCGKLIFRFLCSHPGAPPLGLILASSPLRSQRCPEPGSLESNWPHLEVGGDLKTARSGATLCPLLPALGFGAWACLGSLEGDGLIQMPATDWTEDSHSRVCPGWFPGHSRFVG